MYYFSCDVKSGIPKIQKKITSRMASPDGKMLIAECQFGKFPLDKFNLNDILLAC